MLTKVKNVNVSDFMHEII